MRCDTDQAKTSHQRYSRSQHVDSSLLLPLCWQCFPSRLSNSRPCKRPVVALLSSHRVFLCPKVGQLQTYCYYTIKERLPEQGYYPALRSLPRIAPIPSLPHVQHFPARLKSPLMIVISGGIGRACDSSCNHSHFKIGRSSAVSLRVRESSYFRVPCVVRIVNVAGAGCLGTRFTITSTQPL